MSFEAGKLNAVENLTVPVTQQLAVLKGDLAAITAQLEQWRNVQQEPPVWLDIEITTDNYLHDMQRKNPCLDRRFTGRGVIGAPQSGTARTHYGQ